MVVFAAFFKNCKKFFNNYEGTGWVKKNGVKIQKWQPVFENWFNDDLKAGNTKDMRKKDIDPKRVLEDEDGRCYQEDYDGTRYYI